MMALVPQLERERLSRRDRDRLAVAYDFAREMIYYLPVIFSGRFAPESRQKEACKQHDTNKRPHASPYVLKNNY
jgi:hypothetical protein